jgi:hypothetical protein
VNYYKLLEAEKDNELVLCPFAKHIAQSLFYLNYRWLDKHIKRGRDSVAALILNACSEEPSSVAVTISPATMCGEENIVGHLRHAWAPVFCCMGVVP